MKRLGVGLLIILAVITRVYFSTKYFHIDIFSNAGWGEWIANNGSKGFFYNTVWVYSWPTQLPLVNLIYGWCFDIYRYLIIYLIRFGFLLNKLGMSEWIGVPYASFISWFSGPLSAEIPFKIGFLFSIKLIPMLADLILAATIWKIAVMQKTKNSWIWPLIYLWSPFSIYVSSFWGQYDQLAFGLLIWSIITIKNRPWVSPILMSLSLGVKPTGAIFIPFYIFLMWKNRNKWVAMGIGIVVAIMINVYLIQEFNPSGSFVGFVQEKLIPAVLNKSEQRISVNSYNFWHMIAGDKAVRADSIWMFLPFSFWGALAMGLINWWAIRLDHSKKNMTFAALSVVGMGSWMFGMNMLERYLFAGVMFGMLAMICDKRLRRLWLGLSVVFWINLYKNWWEPVWFWQLRYFAETMPVWSQFMLPLVNLGLMWRWVNYLRDRG